MKTIKNTKTGKVERVSDLDAMSKVRLGWEYCPKGLWKNKTSEETPSEEPKEKKKK